MRPIAIAIDGPVASGKTVVGRLVAKKLGFRFIDTGMMYRAATWAANKAGLDLNDERVLTELAEKMQIRLVLGPDGCERLLVDGGGVTSKLREPEIERGVSLVSKVRGVRAAMVKQQQDVAREGPIVMAGRDIGTVVLPNATIKAFLTASVEVRARRRYLELLEQGKSADYQKVLEDLVRRDKIDSERADSPLRPAADSIIMETDNRTIENLVDEIYKRVRCE